MDSATWSLIGIYAYSYAIGLFPFILFILIIRRFNLQRFRRAVICSLVAAITSTPLMFAVGWFAIFVPVSFGFVLGYERLHWTATMIIPVTPEIHLVSLLVTLALGFAIGWFIKPKIGCAVI